ncbi:hypothetical protein LXH13_39605 [Streptomyces spinosirectus]|uniref:hypothetical protein n=1 Tax=Streptomyces spinosirectus TaxID=2906474 RepID=UPI001F1B3640|nr:hypothetical protein [Streptomyces spinosirectus]UIR22766.1 hypothetical protein LXH13_39605 [Streptomyces spinosirectus]
MAKAVTVSSPDTQATSSSGSVVHGRPWLSSARNEHTPTIAPCEWVVGWQWVVVSGIVGWVAW